MARLTIEMAAWPDVAPEVEMRLESWVSFRSRSCTQESTLLETSWATLWTPLEVAVVRLPSATLARTSTIEPMTTTQIARTPAR